MHVPLIEDNELVRMVLAETLADAGMSVTEAPSAQWALGLAATATAAIPDVLVTDGNFGRGVDGIKAALRAACLVSRARVCDGHCRRGAGEPVLALGFVPVPEIRPRRSSASWAERYLGHPLGRKA